MLLRTIARPLLAVAFVGQGLESLRNPKAAADTARPTLEGLSRLPTPLSAKVPTDGGRVEGFALTIAAVQVGAGALLVSGKLPRIASAALACTVLPGRVGAHMFWNEDDPERKAQQRRDFLTDVSLLGGLMIASADTAGKPSLGWRGRRVARRISEAVSSAAPGGSGSLVGDSDLGEKLAHGVQIGAEHGRDLVSAATEKSGPLVDAARQRGSELAEIARERGADLVDATRRLARSVG
ncbi:MAG TPA: DoxX family protein [Mycobacterium sp.]|nr:DoxX family protein [Mycobacterium sp.]